MIIEKLLLLINSATLQSEHYTATVSSGEWSQTEAGDLTQLTLGLDRDSALVAHVYDERNPAVKRSISNLIKTAREYGVKVGICGQGPSDHKDFAGVRVVKNPFREPYSSNDGQKLYAGKDNYTYDSFGALDIEKYYAVYTFDDVPNYSKPIIIKYSP